MRAFVFVGRVESATEADDLQYEAESLRPGTVLPLERRRSPWSANRPTERVIVGSHPARADLLLQGEGIRPEHVRVYFPREGSGPADLLVIESESTTVGGAPVEPRDWTALVGGEEIDFGPWRFRYQVEEAETTQDSE